MATFQAVDHDPFGEPMRGRIGLPDVSLSSWMGIAPQVATPRSAAGTPTPRAAPPAQIPGRPWSWWAQQAIPIGKRVAQEMIGKKLNKLQGTFQSLGKVMRGEIEATSPEGHRAILEAAHMSMMGPGGAPAGALKSGFTVHPAWNKVAEDMQKKIGVGPAGIVKEMQAGGHHDPIAGAAALAEKNPDIASHIKYAGKKMAEHPDAPQPLDILEHEMGQLLGKKFDEKNPPFAPPPKSPVQEHAEKIGAQPDDLYKQWLVKPTVGNPKSADPGNPEHVASVLYHAAGGDVAKAKAIVDQYAKTDPDVAENAAGALKLLDRPEKLHKAVPLEPEDVSHLNSIPEQYEKYANIAKWDEKVNKTPPEKAAHSAAEEMPIKQYGEFKMHYAGLKPEPSKVPELADPKTLAPADAAKMMFHQNGYDLDAALGDAYITFGEGTPEFSAVAGHLGKLADEHAMGKSFPPLKPYAEPKGKEFPFEPIDWTNYRVAGAINPNLPPEVAARARSMGINPEILLGSGMTTPWKGVGLLDPREFSASRREPGFFAAHDPNVWNAYIEPEKYLSHDYEKRLLGPEELGPAANPHPAEFGPNYVVPLLARGKNALQLDWQKLGYGSAYNPTHMSDIIGAARARDADLLVLKNLRDLSLSGEDRLQDQYVMLSNVGHRVPWAAFDPERQLETNFLYSGQSPYFAASNALQGGQTNEQ